MSVRCPLVPLVRTTVLAVALVVVPGSAIAKPGTGSSSSVIATSARDPKIVREAFIVLAQDKLDPTVDIGRMPPAATGGGLIGTAIIEAQDDRRKILETAAGQRAAAVAIPLQNVLSDIDGNKDIFSAVEAALGRVAWLNVSQIRRVALPPPDYHRFPAEPDARSSGLGVGVGYFLSPDFTQIRTHARLTLADQPDYGQTVICVSELTKRSLDPKENVSAWAANNARLARDALTANNACLTRLIARVLDADPAALASWTAKNLPPAFAGGSFGGVIEREQNRLLLWSKGLVEVRPGVVP